MGKIKVSSLPKEPLGPGEGDRHGQPTASPQRAGRLADAEAGTRNKGHRNSSPREKTGVTLSIYVEPNDRINGTLQHSIPPVAACGLLGKKAGCPRSVLTAWTRPSAERRRGGLRGPRRLSVFHGH